MNRKEFIKQLSILGIASQFTFIYSCDNIRTVVIPTNFNPLTEAEVKILAHVLEILFPSKQSSPSVQQLNSLEHIIWNLNDKNRDENTNKYIIKGINWVEETANEEKETSFLNLSDSKKEDLIEFISTKKWGKDWLSKILTLIFGSLVYDPIYNVNKEQSGWNWLQHKPGYPRPNKSTKYLAKS